MNKYTIAKPIWDGGTKQRAIGIAEFRLPCLVSISYRDKHDNLVYPNQYIVTKEKARKYPIKVLGPVKVRVIPISELDTAPLINNQLDNEKWREKIVFKKGSANDIENE